MSEQKVRQLAERIYVRAHAELLAWAIKSEGSRMTPADAFKGSVKAAEDFEKSWARMQHGLPPESNGEQEGGTDEGSED